MNRAAKRHKKQLARKAAKNRRGHALQPLGHTTGGAAAKSLPKLIQKGVQLHLAGQVQEAEAIYRQVLDINSDHADANHLLGVLLSRAGNHAQAVELISRAITMAPDQPAYYSNLGNVLKRMGRLEEAVASYHKALAIKPDYADALSNLGTVLQELGRLEEAIASYHKILAIRPEADAHNDLGDALQELGRLDDALASYRRALAIKPDYADAHNNLGTVLQELGRLDDALASYRRALAIEPDYADAHSNLGTVLQKLGRLDDAVASFHKALAIKPDYAAAHNNLGNALQELGRPDDALASYRRALAIKPDYADAHRHMARIKKHSEYDTDIRAMEELFASPDMSDKQRTYLAFGLGKAFEDLRQYEKAFDFFLVGNTIKRKTQSYSIEARDLYFRKQKEVFDISLFDKYQGAGCQDDCPIFILGMPRSGTTLVEQILASHSQVFGAGEVPTLPQIFGRFPGVALAEGIRERDAAEFERMGIDYIDAIKKHAEKASFITDKMLSNFQYIGLIKLILPNAKIIHCCRNPLDNCLSIFKSHFTDSGLEYADDLIELGRYYNLYRDLMRHWHSVLPDFIYNIQYEEMVADQAEQTRLLLKHCGLEWEDACLEFYKTDRPVATASAEQVRRPIYKDSVQSWKRYEKQLAPLLEILG